MDYIFERNFTDWVIIVQGRANDKNSEVEYAQKGIIGATLDFEEFSGIYRTTTQDGRECEQFTLLARGVDYAFLWVQIFKNGDVQYISHMPSMIKVTRRKKKVEILPLAYCEFDHEKGCISFNEID